MTPEEFLGDVIGDLSRRRGKVEGQEPRGNALAVARHRPAQRDVRLRRATCAPRPRGAPAYTMQFARYEEVPANIAEEIVESAAGEPGRSSA